MVSGVLLISHFLSCFLEISFLPKTKLSSFQLFQRVWMVCGQKIPRRKIGSIPTPKLLKTLLRLASFPSLIPKQTNNYNYNRNRRYHRSVSARCARAERGSTRLPNHLLQDWRLTARLHGIVASTDPSTNETSDLRAIYYLGSAPRLATVCMLPLKFIC